VDETTIANAAAVIRVKRESMRQGDEEHSPAHREQGPSSGWPDGRVLDLLRIDVPILQAPMAGAQGSALAIAVCQAGGLGFLPCAMLSPEMVRAEVRTIRGATDRPFGLNFFCHRPPVPKPEREASWRERLAPYYREMGLNSSEAPPAASRNPFDETSCELVEELRPAVVSFHFAFPEEWLLQRVKASGAKVLGSATTVAEAIWLAERGCDAIIAQGYEAGGHRGMFLATNVSSQVGTMALVPQVVDAVEVPVIAAGGIVEARGIVAAFALGASAVQIGTAYLLCPEATVSDVHRQALRTLTDDGTAITNVFSGRPARGVVNRLVKEVGPMSPDAPDFPLAATAVAPLRAASEAEGSSDFAQMWSGQAAPLSREMSAEALTRTLASESLQRLRALARFLH
jgi:nitronate monooxygenase